jgi:Family of unknown function (DUF6152)
MVECRHHEVLAAPQQRQRIPQQEGKMSTRTLVKGLAATILLAAASGAPAHHSFAAIWDETRTFTVTGELTKIDWINPHIYYFVDVKSADGKVERYSFEGMPPGMLRNMGLNKDMLTPSLNKQVTVEGYPARNGTKTLGFGRALTLADGRTIQMVGDDPRDLNR